MHSYATEGYCKMVRALAKPGVDIVNELDPRRGHIWHMATGIAGESGELMEAYMNFVGTGNLDFDHIREEIGDTLFYITGIRNEVDFPGPIPMTYDYEGELFGLFAKVSVHACNTLDLVKKYVIYGQDLAINGLNTELCWLELWLSVLANAVQSNLEEIAEGNMLKLSTGPNARYRGGYSDEAAQARRDKSV